MGSSGLSAMISCGAQLELEFENLTVASIGSPAAGDEGHEMELYGSGLAYKITLRASGVTLSAALMDTAAAGWDLLLRITDNAPGWATVRGVITALETHKIQSLKRPIWAAEGDDDPAGWVIA